MLDGWQVVLEEGTFRMIEGDPTPSGRRQRSTPEKCDQVFSNVENLSGHSKDC